MSNAGVCHGYTHRRTNIKDCAASGERRKQMVDNLRSMPQLPATRTAARLAARQEACGTRQRRVARCASETNVLANIEAATAQSGARGGIGGRIEASRDRKK
ncbi:hypothetical protein K1T71_003552 [Dendrolimus kikuchii]|uniref:Uncharacterized protein n=1 Tax=Dendrolimus kikuchii TaxID=765133 RepID=A0ACC1DCX9_9NEOP|nr:hypothetical protein K1T71_003552 [Dendrolimus kikuchii]